MEAPRGGVLCRSLLPGGPKCHSFLASDTRFKSFGDIAVFNPANLLMLSHTIGWIA